MTECRGPKYASMVYICDTLQPRVARAGASGNLAACRGFENRNAVESVWSSLGAQAARAVDSRGGGFRVVLTRIAIVRTILAMSRQGGGVLSVREKETGTVKRARMASNRVMGATAVT
jgi:hypothetical protein